MMKRLLFALALLVAPAAHAANCSGYTYTLTNGQVADANQVMANFNTIMNCANVSLLSVTTAASTYAPIASPVFTGIPQAPTAGAGTNTTQVATTAFTTGAVSTLSATAAATYAPLASPALTGTPTAPTAAPGTNTTQVATTAFVLANGLKAIQVQNQQSSGTTSGETIPSATWTKRTLNTAVSNTVTGASLASSQVTLPAGTYQLVASASYEESGGGNGVARLRLRNVTDSTTVLVGAGSSTVSLTGIPLPLGGVFTLAGSKVLEIDCYSSTSVSGSGGRASSSGEVEVYVDATFVKIG